MLPENHSHVLHTYASADENHQCNSTLLIALLFDLMVCSLLRPVYLCCSLLDRIVERSTVVNLKNEHACLTDMA